MCMEQLTVKACKRCVVNEKQSAVVKQQTCSRFCLNSEPEGVSYVHGTAYC